MLKRNVNIFKRKLRGIIEAQLEMVEDLHSIERIYVNFCDPWKKNKQWLHLLSYSNTPLFVSCNNTVTNEQKKDLATAYKVFNETHDIRPVDIYGTKTPCEWEIDGEKVIYDWQ